MNSSIRSLKVILLHNTNVLAPVPIAHSTFLKKSYDNIKIVLEKTKYSELSIEDLRRSQDHWHFSKHAKRKH